MPAHATFYFLTARSNHDIKFQTILQKFPVPGHHPHLEILDPDCKVDHDWSQINCYYKAESL